MLLLSLEDAGDPGQRYFFQFFQHILISTLFRLKQVHSLHENRGAYILALK